MFDNNPCILALVDGPHLEVKDGNLILTMERLNVSDSGRRHLMAVQQPTKTVVVDSNRIPFSIDDPEFDSEKFSGRFNSFLKVMNPIHAFYSNDRIRSFQKLVDDQRALE